MEDKQIKKIKQRVIGSSLVVTLSIIAEIYIVMKVTFYPFIFAIVLGALAAGAMYFLVGGLLKLSDIKNQIRDEQYENTIKSQKASYILHKKYFENEFCLKSSCDTI